jgi:hypothetical protein
MACVRIISRRWYHKNKGLVELRISTVEYVEDLVFKYGGGPKNQKNHSPHLPLATISLMSLQHTQKARDEWF